MDSLITFEKLTAQHLPYLYEIRFPLKKTCCIRIRSSICSANRRWRTSTRAAVGSAKYGDDYAGVGFGLFIPEPLIGGLFVKPEYQSKGIGSALLARVTHWMFEHGAEAIHLTTDLGSKAEGFINVTAGSWSGRMNLARPNW